MNAPAAFVTLASVASKSEHIDWVLRIVDRRNVAEGIVAFDLEATHDAPDPFLPAFDAGAHLEVRCGEQRRHYSLCSDPADPLRYTIAVQREATGRGGSKYLCDTLHIGDTIHVNGPHNHFPLHQADEAPLLIAGGIGVTPMLAMAWALDNAGMGFEWHDFSGHAARQAFHEAIDAAPWRHQVTRHIGRCMHFDALIGPFLPGRHLYVCGPLAMIDAVIAAAQTMGWPDDHLHFERFGASLPRVAPAEDGAEGGGDSRPERAFEVKLASTGRTVTVPIGQSVCAALRAIGVAIPMSCEQGVCGSCITRVLDGVPEHRDWILSAAEQAAGDRFTPCCSRAKTPSLLLDL